MSIFLINKQKIEDLHPTLGTSGWDEKKLTQNQDQNITFI